MKGSVVTCKFCGKPIMVITYGVYRKAVVDAEAVDGTPAGAEQVPAAPAKPKPAPKKKPRDEIEQRFMSWWE